MATHSSILAWRIPMDRGAWWTRVHGVAKSRKGLSDFHFSQQKLTQHFKAITCLVSQFSCLVSQLCPTLCNPMNCCLSGSSVHRDSPGKNSGVGCHALLQGIFPIQGSNPGSLHCRWIFYYLSHQGSPRIVEWVAYPFSRGSV